jgi:two-component system phosphate regulon response regulator PhoB
MATVLIVDDDPDIRELVGFQLRRAGFEVFTEPDGERGLATALEIRPDVAVLDWMMPKLTGVELCRRLRADPATAWVRVLLLTARSSPESLEEGLAAGADDYVAKPFSNSDLVRRVRALADQAA